MTDDDPPWDGAYYAVTDANGELIEVWPAEWRAERRRDALPDGEGVEEREDVPCFCAGEKPEWEYHHPTGCGEGGQGWASVTQGDTHDRIGEPYVPE